MTDFNVVKRLLMVELLLFSFSISARRRSTTAAVISFNCIGSRVGKFFFRFLISLSPDLGNRTYGDHIEPLVIVAMNTGMRKGELLSLTWADVNFEREFVTVKAVNAKSGKARRKRSI